MIYPTLSRRFLSIAAMVVGLFLLVGADGCSSDPNVEGAKLNLRNKDYATAIENLDKAIANNPENAEAYRFKALALTEMARAERDATVRRGYYVDAVKAMDEARRLGYDAADLAAMRYASWGTEINDGISDYQADDRLDEAIVHFGNATMIQPDSSAGHALLGRAYYTNEQFAESIDPLEKAIAGNTEDENTYILLGNVYLAINDNCSDAIRILEIGQTAFSENESIEELLIEGYKKCGRLEDAKARYRTAVERSPDSAEAHTRYGSVLLQMGEYDEAVAELVKAVELDPNLGVANYNLGIGYYNKAAELNTKMNETEEVDLATTLRAERDKFFEMAIPFLVKARSMNDAEGNDNVLICDALFRSYANLGRSSEAEEAAACAGVDLN